MKNLGKNLSIYAGMFLLIFQNTAQAKLTEEMKEEITKYAIMIDKAQISYLNTEVQKRKEVFSSELPVEEGLFSFALNQYPQLDNSADQAELRAFISDVRKGYHKLRFYNPSGTCDPKLVPSSALSSLAPYFSVNKDQPLEGTWMISDYSYLTVKGKTVTVTGKMHGCTEVWTSELEYVSPGKAQMKRVGPNEVFPKNCGSGPSVPFLPEGQIDYARDGINLHLTWYTAVGQPVKSLGTHAKEDPHLKEIGYQPRPTSHSSNSDMGASSCGINPRISQRGSSGGSSISFITIGSVSSPALRPGDSFVSVDSGRIYTAGSGIQ